MDSNPGGSQDCCGASAVDGPAPEEPVIACSLSGSDQAERLERWHALLADARLTRTPLIATAEIASERSADATALIRDEQACCPFLGFQLDFRGSVTVLTIGAPRPEAEAFIDALLPPGTETGR